MGKFRSFLDRKNIVFSLKRYGIDAVSAMAQGLFCTLLVGTILNTLGTQLHIGFLTRAVVTVGGSGLTIGSIASAMAGPAMAVAIGYALQAPAMVLFTLAPVGYATNLLGGAGGPLAVLVVAIIAAEVGKAVSKETKIDILVTPIVTLIAGVGLAWLVASPIGQAANWLGKLVMWATELHPFMMGNIVRNPRIWAAPIIASMITGPVATCIFHLEMNGAAINSGMGTCGLCGPIGVWTGWVEPSASALAGGAQAISATAMDWIGLALVSVALPALLCWLMGILFRRIGWIRENDLLLS